MVRNKRQNQNHLPPTHFHIFSASPVLIHSWVLYLPFTSSWEVQGAREQGSAASLHQLPSAAPALSGCSPTPRGSPQAAVPSADFCRLGGVSEGVSVGLARATPPALLWGLAELFLTLCPCLSFEKNPVFLVWMISFKMTSGGVFLSFTFTHLIHCENSSRHSLSL